MLSLQSFLREGRVVGPRWEKLKPKGPKGRSCLGHAGLVINKLSLGARKLAVSCLAGPRHLEQLMFRWIKFVFGRDLQLGY